MSVLGGVVNVICGYCHSCALQMANALIKTSCTGTSSPRTPFLPQSLPSLTNPAHYLWGMCVCVSFFFVCLFVFVCILIPHPHTPRPGSGPGSSDSLVEGRLYRSGTRFSNEQLHEHLHQQQLDDGSDSDHLVASVSSPPMMSQTDADSDTADPNRTSFVKFAEDSDGDDDKETPFVRHNTPHPKDLKAKAQKHFKGKKIDGKVVHHDEQDGLKEGEAFKPDRTAQELPYRRSSPLPPLQLIDLPDRDVEPPGRSGPVFPAEQYDDHRQTSSPSPVPEPHEKAVAFVDQYEHRSIEEADENEEVLSFVYFCLFFFFRALF